MDKYYYEIEYYQVICDDDSDYYVEEFGTADDAVAFAKEKEDFCKCIKVLQVRRLFYN